jgi:hypothetical protein
MKTLILRMILCVGCLLALVACAKNADPAAQVVEKYLTTMVSGNTDQAVLLVCKDFEAQARQDVDAFGGVKAALDGMTCSNSGMSGSDTQVQCKGKIKATYGVENQEFDLSGQTYLVRQEGGEWRVCGRK